MQDEFEAEYWNRFDEMSAEWEKRLAAGAKYTNPPGDMFPGEAMDPPDGSESSKVRAPKTTAEALEAAQAAADAVAQNGAAPDPAAVST